MMSPVQYIDSQLVLSPTDLVGFLECAHLTTLDRLVALAEPDHDGNPVLSPPEAPDSALELLRTLGLKHEAEYRERLREEGLAIAEIDTTDLARAVTATNDAMVSGVDVVFQATFLRGRWRGHADFLRRVERPSALGEWSYEPYDTKLARGAKASALLQLADYAEHLTAVQELEPARLHVVTGNNNIESFRTDQLGPYLRRARARLIAQVDQHPRTVSRRCAKCVECRWSDRCQAEWEARDDLQLVARLRRAQADHLHEMGITTVAALADSSDDACPARMGEETFATLRRQARLQVAARSGPDSVEILDPSHHPTGGFAELPEPDTHDLFFDLEGNPHHQPRGLEYLWGISDVHDRYRRWWAFDSAAEREVFEAVMDMFGEHCDRHPDAHIYHYANYEIAVLKRLSALHSSREAALDRLLRERRFVDLYRVVRAAVAISRPGYSIKQFESFYRGARETGVVSGMESVVQYHRWMSSGDDSVLSDIEAYNTDDCVSTRQLRDWLEQRRDEAVERFGDVDRPDHPDTSPSAAADEDAARGVLFDSMIAAVDDGETDSPQWILAHLLGWHRRENRADWWRYFERLAMGPAQLYDDSEAIGDLHFVGVVGEVKRSRLYRYAFDPDQPFKLKPGDTVDEPGSGDRFGEIHRLDPMTGTVDIKRGTAPSSHPGGLMPGSPYDTRVLSEAVEAVATAQTDRTAIDALLARRPPALRGGAPLLVEGEPPAERLLRVGRLLDGTTLAVQGPPGSGKTTRGAELIARLVDDGMRVGVCANSHAVVANLLESVSKVGGDCSDPIDIVKVGGEPLSFARAMGSRDAERSWLAGDGDVVGATAWFFARPAMRGEVDVLVIDEAGQFSLANAVAVSGCATNMILLGDPAQLDQPVKGVHPAGTSASALGHFLGADATLPGERGVFLDTSYRMHPDVCSFVSRLSYEGRLHNDPKTTARSIEGVEHGLWWVPVHHEGNRSRSRQEAVAVRSVIDDLIDRPFIDGDRVRGLGPDDFLVITPFNAQVRELAELLPQSVEVGTVDRFQGRQAPVVVYSMAASSADDAPRGPGFLFHRNRFNVALSRAQRLAVVVASPMLLDTRCNSARELMDVSALCGFVESADPRVYTSGDPVEEHP